MSDTKGVNATRVFSRAYMLRVLDAANIVNSYENDPWCTCGYCEDARAYEVKQFNAIMAAVNLPDDGDIEKENAELAVLKAKGTDRNGWK